MYRPGWGQSGEAEASLRQALGLDPQNSMAHFNLGLLLAEKGERRGAAQALRTALHSDPGLAEVAYNLGVLLAEDRSPESLRWLQKAQELRPQQPKYANTPAFFQRQQGDSQGAIKGLRRLLREYPALADAYLLLGDIYQERGNSEEAGRVYRRGLARSEIPGEARQALETKLRALSGRKTSQ